MKDPIFLRPHHVLCAIGWQGRGYSPAFTENMNQIVLGQLRADPQMPVCITFEADSICAPCPHRRGTGCASGDKIAGLDARHASALNLRHGQEMTWAEAEARALALEPDDLDQICAGCDWLAFGLCKSALEARKRAAA